MMSRYLSGLCVAGLGLCGGGWLVVVAVAFGGESAGLAGRVNLLTGAVLIAVSCLSLACWSCAWRQRMCADGILADRFLLVSRRAARRNRRALSRGVRRAGKLAERSARGARRSARRSARAGGGGVLSAGVGLGSTSPADESFGVAVSYGPSASSANGNGVAANGSGGTGASGSEAENAAELISQLREMLVPLLAAGGSQPVLGGQTGAAESALPRRTPSASAFKPRAASVPMSVPVSVALQAPRARVPRAPASQVTEAAVGDGGLGDPIDCDEAWW
jgi:hypothetical protein